MSVVAEFTLEEIEKHDSPEDCWIVVSGKVYDISKYVAKDDHPGGVEIILELVNDPEAFEDMGHSSDAFGLLEDYFIGMLKVESEKTAAIEDASKPKNNENDQTTDAQKAVSALKGYFDVLYSAAMRLLNKVNSKE